MAVAAPLRNPSTARTAIDWLSLRCMRFRQNAMASSAISTPALWAGGGIVPDAGSKGQYDRVASRVRHRQQRCDCGQKCGQEFHCFARCAIWRCAVSLAPTYLAKSIPPLARPTSAVSIRFGSFTRGSSRQPAGWVERSEIHRGIACEGWVSRRAQPILRTERHAPTADRGRPGPCRVPIAPPLQAGEGSSGNQSAPTPRPDDLHRRTGRCLTDPKPRARRSEVEGRPVTV